MATPIRLAGLTGLHPVTMETQCLTSPGCPHGRPLGAARRRVIVRPPRQELVGPSIGSGLKPSHRPERVGVFGPQSPQQPMVIRN